MNIGDFIKHTKGSKDAIISLLVGMILSCVLFAITCMALIAGTEIVFGEPIFNIAIAIDKMNSNTAVIILILVLNVGVTVFMFLANLLPADLQLSSLFPKIFTVKIGGILTAIIGILILPWKLVYGASDLFLFYSLVGSIFGPILGTIFLVFILKETS